MIIVSIPKQRQVRRFTAAGFTPRAEHDQAVKLRLFQRVLPGLEEEEVVFMTQADELEELRPIAGRIVRPFNPGPITDAVEWTEWSAKYTGIFIAAASVAATYDSSIVTESGDYMFKLRHFGPFPDKMASAAFDEHVFDAQDAHRGYTHSKDQDIWFCPKSGVISTYDKQFLKTVPAILHQTNQFYFGG